MGGLLSEVETNGPLKEKNSQPLKYNIDSLQKPKLFVKNFSSECVKNEIFFSLLKLNITRTTMFVSRDSRMEKYV